MKQIILDTNAYTALLRGDEEVLGVVASAEVVFMSIFVLGELYAGFSGGAKQRQNNDVLKRFLGKPSVKILNATAETAEVFGELKTCSSRLDHHCPSMTSGSRPTVWRRDRSSSPMIGTSRGSVVSGYGRDRKKRGNPISTEAPLEMKLACCLKRGANA